MLRTARQVVALLQISLSGMQGRWGALVVTVIGTTCVVGVLISMLAVGGGIRRVWMSHVAPDHVMVMAAGPQGQGGPLSRDAVRIIEEAPGIKRGIDGKPLVAALTFSSMEVRRKADNVRFNIPIDAAQPGFLAVVPELRIIAGRMFRPAVHELIVSKTRALEAKDVAIGDRIRLRGTDWTVVGHFEAPGTLRWGAITDADTLMSAFGMDTFQLVEAVLASPASFPTLKRALTSNPALGVAVQYQAQWAAENARGSTGLLDFVSYFIGTVMAIGATLGAVSALYALVDQRRRDIATLRTIGFGNFALIVAVLLESLLMALPGAVLGAVAAWVFFNGHHVSPFGQSMDLAVTGQIVIIGIVWALAMGLVGGLLPALRAARVPVATALRGT